MNAARHYHLATEYRAAEFYSLAAREYQTAIGFYAPCNAYSRSAAENMLDLVGELENKDPDLARDVTDRLKRALAGIRSLYQPYSDLLHGQPTLQIRTDNDPGMIAYVLSLVFALITLSIWRFSRFSVLNRSVISLVSCILWALCLYLS